MSFDRARLSSSRINITLDLETNGATAQHELPLKLLFLGDFDKKQQAIPVRLRQRYRIDGARLKTVLSHLQPSLDFAVTLPDETSLAVHLRFQSMQDFHPNALIEQIPTLRTLVVMRHLLKELKASVMDKPEFRRALTTIAQDAGVREQLINELRPLTPEILHGAQHA